MGKRILVQRRGRGSPTFRASTHKRVAPSRYPPQVKPLLQGIVKDLVHDPGRGAPLAEISVEELGTFYMVAVEGLSVGDAIQIGKNAAVRTGNVLPLGEIPAGTMVCNIEKQPGDGGKLVRSSGTYAIVLDHTPQGTIVKLPSGKRVVLNDACRAMVGMVAGGGRTEMPFLKAGKKYHWMRAKGHKYPRTRGVAMNPCSHPFGGGSHQHIGKPSTVARTAPPGQKVGYIAARKTGRGKKRK